MSREPTEEQVQSKFEHYRSFPIIQAALEELSKKLSPDLHYHSLEHTLDVVQEVIRLALADGLSEREMELLAIGAAYHDIGFIWKQQDNEWLAASRVREAMESTGGYREAEIQSVQDMIIDTQLVHVSSVSIQMPSSPLGKYLLDADLGNLGREDFFIKSELLRRELGASHLHFFKHSLGFLHAHSWHTPAARALRSEGRAKNIETLKDKIHALEKGKEEAEEFGGLDISQLLFLSRLPLLLNSSLNTERLVETAIEHLRGILNAEAATVFMLDESGNHLRFWALKGGEAKLQDKLLPADRGLVGWVIKNKAPLLTNDPQNDPRFYSGFDKESTFKTKSVICAPMMVRSERTIGALQVLNKKDDGHFSERDLLLLERFGHQMALAIENSVLYERADGMRKMLEKLDQRKGEMITVLTHELRTPLNVIQGAADLLGNPDIADPKIREKMSETLQRGVQRLVKLSQQLQSLSRVQGNHAEIQRRTFPIGQLVSALEERFEGPMRVRNLNFVIDCSNKEQPIHVDESLIFLVLSNLLSNAIRFTEDGGTVILRVVVEHGVAQFSVEDTGIGIPIDEQRSIFEKFYEVGNALVHSSGDYGFRSGGLGLGLATVKTIVAAHGSEVTVDSTPGKGSTFRFSLPLPK